MTDELKYISERYNYSKNALVKADRKNTVKVGEYEESPFFTSIRNIDAFNLEKIKGCLMEKSGDNNYNLTEKNVENLYRILDCYRDKRYETFRYIFVSKDTGEIREQIAFSDENPASATIPRQMTEFCKDYCRDNNYGVIMCHNHPSGDTSPSSFDIYSTDEVRKVLKDDFLGHIILDHENVNYFDPSLNKFTEKKIDRKNEKDFLIKETDDGILNYHLNTFGEGTTEEIALLLNDKNYYDSRFFPVLFINDYDVRGVQFFSDSFFLSKDKDAMRNRIFESAKKCGATGCFVSMPLDYSDKLTESEKKMFSDNFREGIEKGCFYDAGIEGKSVYFSNKMEYARDLEGERKGKIRSTIPLEYYNIPGVDILRAARNLEFAKETFRKSLARKMIEDKELQKNVNLALIFNGLNKDEVKDCWEVLTDIADYKRKQKHMNRLENINVNINQNINVHGRRR